VTAWTSPASGTPRVRSDAAPTSVRSLSRSSATAWVAAASRLASCARRSVNAAAAPVRNATASWISKSSVTRVPDTPRSYSTGTSARKRRSCCARRAASGWVNGAAVNPSSAWVTSAKRAFHVTASPWAAARASASTAAVIRTAAGSPRSSA
jgi:hypothetical protein